MFFFLKVLMCSVIMFGIYAICMITQKLVLHLNRNPDTEMQIFCINTFFLYLCLGNNCPYISDDLNEDTISVLVRLITEKKGTCQSEHLQ